MPKIDPVMKKVPFLRATQKQQDYIEILANDIGLNLNQRIFFITDTIGRVVKHLDELSLAEGSLVISTFKRWKDNGKPEGSPSIHGEEGETTG